MPFGKRSKLFSFMSHVSSSVRGTENGRTTGNNSVVSAASMTFS